MELKRLIDITFGVTANAIKGVKELCLVVGMNDHISEYVGI